MNVTCSSEQNHTSAPSIDGLPWSMPSALRPQSATGTTRVDGDRRSPRTASAGRNGRSSLRVRGVHQRVGAGLDLGGERVDVVGAGAAAGDDGAADVVVRRERARHRLGRLADPLAQGRPSPRRGPRSPSCPARRARGAASGRRGGPASSGAQPQRGKPTLTSISTSRIPPCGRRVDRRLGVDRDRDARAERGERARAGRRRPTSLASRRSSPRPARGQADRARVASRR